MKNCLLSPPRRTVKMIACMLRPGLRRKTFQPIVCFVYARSTFSRSVIVSVGVSALGKTDSHFIEPRVKISGAYYRDYLLSEKLLSNIREYSDYFTFQQDSAPAHRARETADLLKKVTPDFIPPNLWPPNSPDLNPVDYKIWGIIQYNTIQFRLLKTIRIKAGRSQLTQPQLRPVT